MYTEKKEYIHEICNTFPRVDEENKPQPYCVGFMNHPSTVWARSSKENYLYTLQLGKELCQEYTYRYGKVHACEKIVDWFFQQSKQLEFLSVHFTAPYQAMPEDCKSNNSVDSYRMYYIKYKNFATWKNREIPKWYSELKTV
jgi:hypothetical protein